jgi:3-isopropylmalate/(R)-2-methylmalate dehydratase large subunit
MPRTAFDKLWDLHMVRAFADGSALLALDRVFLHERTGSLAVNHVLDTGRRVAAPQRVFAVMDHVIDTVPGRTDRTMMPGGTEFITALRDAAGRAGAQLFDLDHPDQGISHVVAAELGLVLPGYSYVCPDSHACTLGALGALAWGIGTSDCEQAVATQMLRVVKPAQTLVRIEGLLPTGTSAKDLALYVIARFGAAGGARHAVEYAGPAITSLDMGGRFTLCNMAVEFSAFTAVIAPDATTLAYVRDRRAAPKSAEYDAAAAAWSALASDTDAKFDRELRIDASAVAPMVSWGTALDHTVPVDGVVPAPQSLPGERRERAERAIEYMGLAPGAPIAGQPIDAAFIGSCTNGRLADLRSAAAVLRGRRVAPGVRALCVPASQAVKRAAEAEGLREVFVDAGFEWREPGCSLCFYAGGEGFEPGQRIISSTNRNFEGRQGPRVRTHVASPAMVAASAVTGVITDPRSLQR